MSDKQPAEQVIVWGRQVIITGIDWSTGSDVMALIICVAGGGVTIQVKGIIISREDGDRIVAAIKQWKAAHGIPEGSMECKISLSPSEWQQAYLGKWGDEEK